MKILNTILYTLILNFLLITCLYSVPHINGRDFGPKEYARPKRTSKGAIAKTITTTGIRKVAVILVNFVSAGTDTSGSETMLTDEIFSLNYNFTYLKNFYKEVYPTSRFLPDDVDISKKAAKYTVPIYLDDNFTPVAVYYSGRRIYSLIDLPDPNKKAIPFFQNQQGEFVLITRNNILRELDTAGLKYKILDSNSFLSIIKRP